MKKVAELYNQFRLTLTNFLDCYLVERSGSFSCHAREGGHPVEPTNCLWFPASAGMTRVRSRTFPVPHLFINKAHT
jgi:hypothetical protein